MTAAMKSEDISFLAGKLWQARQCVEKQRHYSANKSPYNQGYGLPSGHVWLWELDNKEGRVPKNWCLQIVVLGKIPQSPLDSKEIKSIHLKGNQPWILGRTDVEAETPVFWSFDVCKSWLIGKVPGTGKDWWQKRVSEDEMAGWHHRGKGHELGQTSGDGEGQRGLVFCSPCVAESDMTGQLNNRTRFSNKSRMPMLPCKLLCHLS